MGHGKFLLCSLDDGSVKTFSFLLIYIYFFRSYCILVPFLFNGCFILSWYRVGSKLVYHRLPWSEPETPFLLEVLYEDDDMV